MLIQDAIVTTGQEPGQPGQIRVNYTPRRGGKNPVEVKWNQQHIMGSPFYVDVLDLETLAMEGEENPPGNYPWFDGLLKFFKDFSKMYGNNHGMLLQLAKVNETD